MIGRFVMLFAVVGVAAVASAEPSSVEARRHYDEGNTAYSLGDFAHAAEEYKAAYKAKPDPAFLYNIAQAYRLGNDAQNALFFYRSFLHNLPNAPNRREVEDRIAKLEAQLASRDAIAKQPPNTTIPPVGGTHEPATAPEPKSSSSDAARGAGAAKPTPAPTAVARPDLTPPPSSVASDSSTVVAAAPPARTPVYKKWWLWTVVGVVVAGAAAGTAAGIVLSKPSAPDSHFGTVSVYQ